MGMILVDGVVIKTPSVFSWGLQDISDADSGRTLDLLMHKNREGQKRKISLAWNMPTKGETATLLQAFNPEYINITYPDALSGEDETRVFYVGDRSAPVQMWSIDKKYYSSVSFDVIER